MKPLSAARLFIPLVAAFAALALTSSSARAATLVWDNDTQPDHRYQTH